MYCHFSMDFSFLYSPPFIYSNVFLLKVFPLNISWMVPILKLFSELFWKYIWKLRVVKGFSLVLPWGTLTKSPRFVYYDCALQNANVSEVKWYHFLRGGFFYDPIGHPLDLRCCIEWCFRFCITKNAFTAHTCGHCLTFYEFYFTNDTLNISCRRNAILSANSWKLKPNWINIIEANQSLLNRNSVLTKQTLHLLITR